MRHSKDAERLTAEQVFRARQVLSVTQHDMALLLGLPNPAVAGRNRICGWETGRYPCSMPSLVRRALMFIACEGNLRMEMAEAIGWNGIAAEVAESLTKS